jgi:hypothetical protein
VAAGFSPFDAQFKSILDRVVKLESDVGKDVALLNSEGKLLAFCLMSNN